MTKRTATAAAVMSFGALTGCDTAKQVSGSSSAVPQAPPSPHSSGPPAAATVFGGSPASALNLEHFDTGELGTFTR